MVRRRSRSPLRVWGGGHGVLAGMPDDIRNRVAGLSRLEAGSTPGVGPTYITRGARGPAASALFSPPEPLVVNFATTRAQWMDVQVAGWAAGGFEVVADQKCVVDLVGPLGSVVGTISFPAGGGQNNVPFVVTVPRVSVQVTVPPLPDACTINWQIYLRNNT